MRVKACLTEAWPLGEKLARWSVVEDVRALVNIGITFGLQSFACSSRKLLWRSNWLFKTSLRGFDLALMAILARRAHCHIGINAIDEK